jgi:hypothetical protein
VIGRCYKRHRAIEFRRFLDDIDANVALQPGSRQRLQA